MSGPYILGLVLAFIGGNFTAAVGLGIKHGWKDPS